jgi:hypothetical protein
VVRELVYQHAAALAERWRGQVTGAGG